jgi:hypothetical protein
MARALESMTVDQLDAASTKLKKQIGALQEQRQRIHDVRSAKVDADRARDVQEAKGKPGIVVGVGGETTEHEGEAN